MDEKQHDNGTYSWECLLLPFSFAFFNYRNLAQCHNDVTCLQIEGLTACCFFWTSSAWCRLCVQTAAAAVTCLLQSLVAAFLWSKGFYSKCTHFVQLCKDNVHQQGVLPCGIWEHSLYHPWPFTWNQDGWLMCSLSTDKGERHGKIIIFYTVFFLQYLLSLWPLVREQDLVARKVCKPC